MSWVRCYHRQNQEKNIFDKAMRLQQNYLPFLLTTPTTTEVLSARNNLLTPTEIYLCQLITHPCVSQNSLVARPSPSLLAYLFIWFSISKTVPLFFSQTKGTLLLVSFPKEHTLVCSYPARPFPCCSS